MTVFKTGFNWIDFFSKLFSIDFSETSKTTNAGIIYDQKLTFDIQGDDISVNAEFYKIINYPLIFKLIYEDNTSKILGDITNPCFILKDLDSKTLDTVHKFIVEHEDYKPSLYLNI